MDATRARASISLGLLLHGFLSLKARLARWSGASALRRSIAPIARAGAPRAVEPRFGAPPRAPDAGGRRADDADEDDGRTRRSRRAAARAAASRRAAPGRRQDGYQLPPLNLLAAPKANERYAPSMEAIKENGTALEGVLAGFRRARRDHQRAARPGGHALRARAGARHQVVARDRACRRHRALHERALGARRRGVRAATPSASSCPTRSARRSICASCSPPRTTAAPAPSCRSASARPSAASR